jgi:hypothetical protein
MGSAGAVVKRGATHVKRLAFIYALADRSYDAAGNVVIEDDHLRAALAVWDYCSDSAAYVFGGGVDAATAESEKAARLAYRALAYCRDAGRPVSRTELGEHLFGSHYKAGNVDAVAEYAVTHHLLTVTAGDRSKPGRPAELYVPAAIYPPSSGLSPHAGGGQTNGSTSGFEAIYPLSPHSPPVNGAAHGNGEHGDDEAQSMARALADAQERKP